MSWIALFGALESGLIYAIVALGVYISFRVLDFPDLTADGSFPLGGAVCAIGLVAGWNPWVAMLAAIVAGAIAGMVTAWLHVSLKILQLLASILVMTALYSVNLHVMHNSPNIALLGVDTIFTRFVTPENGAWMRVLVIFVIAMLCKFGLDWFFSTQMGLAMRSTGSNLRMSQAQGINTARMTIIGMAISNALIALAGAIFVQTQGGADISSGIGTIVIGLAAVIIGETLIPAKRMLWITLSVLLGAVIYKFFIQLALGSETLRNIGFGPQDLNLVTALLVVFVLVLPQIQGKMRSRNHSNRHKTSLQKGGR